MHIKINIGLLWALLLLAGSAAIAKPVSGPLRIHPDNPRYFTDNSGRAILLAGSHTWNSLVDMGPANTPNSFNYNAYLNWLQARGHNFFRLWASEQLSWNECRNRQNIYFTSPHPWKRTGPGNARDGKPKFDLQKFNEEYFTRLRERVQSAQDRGIYVAVMLFEGWGIQFRPRALQQHPFYPGNNVNGIKGDLNGDGRGLEIHSGRSQKITELQQAYVRKIIDTVNDFDNVLYEIANEAHPTSTAWQYKMIRYIKEYEATKPKQHPVGMTFQHKGGSNRTLFNSPADWISPNHQGGYRDNPPAANGSKVIISDTDHLWGIGGSADWVWKSFLRGLNPIFMDPYNGAVPCEKRDLKWTEPIRVSLGEAVKWSKQVNLASMTPRADLASSKYCLANPGVEYLVYSPNRKVLTVSLQAGQYTAVWYNTITRRKTSAGSFHHSGGKRNFATPFQGALLYARIVK